MLIRNKEYQSGFTLIELSIVLIIIGLVVAGVVAGKELIRQAELRAVMSDVESYRVSIQAFYLKYDDMPGDMQDASSYFSGAIDGDGNGLYTCTTNVLEETYGLWQHLSLAGMIAGDYDGDVVGCGSADALVVGEDMPAGPIKNSHFLMGESARKILLSGYGNPYFASTIIDGILSSTEGYLIDKKFDDGISSTGKIEANRTRLMWGQPAYSEYCQSDSASPVTYNLDDTGTNCYMGFTLNCCF